MQAVIIDDVKEARENLKTDLADYCSQVQVIGEADGVLTGAKVIRKLQPEVVFLDIQMQDGSGFDLLDIIGDTSCKIIFTTASDAYAIKAFRFSAIDYLMKPIDPDELVSAVEKASASPIDHSGQFDLLRDHIQQGKKPLKRIALHTQDKIHVVDISDIVRCESNGNYTMFYFTGGNRLLVTKTLKEFDKLLADHQFLRVHQSHLINAAYLKEYVKIDGGYLVMTDNSEVPVSTRKRSQVMEMIEQL